MIELDEEYLKERYKTLPESAQHDFEDRLLKIGFILDDETSMYGSKREIEKHGYSNIHYQIITKDTYDEEGWNNKLDELYDLIDLFEEDYDCSITFNAGLSTDGRITAGIDIRDYWEADEGTDQIAPSKGQHLTFRNGELEDTDNNKFVLNDISSHMNIDKDTIVKAVPVDKKIHESKNDTVDLEYDELPVTYYYDRFLTRNPYEYEEEEYKINYTYRLDKSEVVDALFDLLEDDSDFDDYSTEEFVNYITENFDSLVDKHYDDLLDYFKERAIEEAEEDFDPEDYRYDDSDFDDYR